MAMRRTLWSAALALILALAACAGPTAPAALGPQPTHPAWLVGTWEGDAWQVAATEAAQGDVRVIVTFASDGAWKASMPSGTWSGTSSMVGDRLVLQGTDQSGGKIRYTLKDRATGSGHELWGMVEASFGAAILNLQRVR